MANRRIITTELLYTSKGDPIPNGMIVIEDNQTIIEVGQDIQTNGLEVEFYEGALCPAFVNMHCHLELSHLKGKVSENTGLDGFIRELQAIRKTDESEVAHAIVEAEKELRNEGIIAVGDISNGNSTFLTKQQSELYFHTFIELFAFDSKVAEATIDRGVELAKQAKRYNLSSSIVPHSPYSVSHKLFELISNLEDNTLLSIHNQESRSENEMFQKGQGNMIELLKGFGLDISTFKISGKSSLLSYLEKLPPTIPLLLVHNTYTSKEDIIVAESKHKNLYWCFCPRANQYIESRLPDILAFDNAGVKCTLGTDSLASNYSLSIWEEIKCIRERYPTIALSTLIKWATINGAEFLGIEKKYGSIEVGKMAAINQLINGKVVPLIFQ